MNSSLIKHFIPFLIVSFAFLTFAQSCGFVKSPDAHVDKVSRYESKETSLIDNKQEIISPSYVPPDSGGTNNKWSCNRHRELMKDRNCYFGKGIRKCGSGLGKCNDD